MTLECMGESIAFVVEPVQVPWSVSPAMSGVELFASDEDLPRIRLRVVPLFETHGPDELTVELRFSWPGGWVSVWPGEYPDLIDFSRVEVVSEPGQPPSVYRLEVIEFYEQKGYHPCPHFYRVQNSAWLSSLSFAPKGLKHYLIEGDGTVWHIATGGFEWSVVGSDHNGA